jgi:two-component system OmpR family response regulator
MGTSNNVKVLLVEDDQNLGSILRDYLVAKGYATTLARNGKEGYDQFSKGNFDMCILDVMMPVKDGFTLAEEIRQTDKEIPIMFLTAKSMKDDRIAGLQKGADDYLTKPFAMDELLLRMQAILRRTRPDTAKPRAKGPVAICAFTFDPEHRTLTLGDDVQRLTTKENDLLNMLFENRFDVLDRSYALNRIWGDDSYFNSRSMDVYVAKLRKYLSKDPKVQIVNIHGKGFKMLTDED